MKTELLLVVVACATNFPIHWGQRGRGAVGADTGVHRDFATAQLTQFLHRIWWGRTGRRVTVAFGRMASRGWDKQHRTGGGKEWTHIFELHKKCDLLVVLCMHCQCAGRWFAGTRL